MGKNITSQTTQYIHNKSFDDTYEQQAVEILVENVAETALVRQKPIATEAKQDDIISAVSTEYAMRLVKKSDDTKVTYIGKAAVGSASTSAVWQIAKLDSSSGNIITWCDGDANFDNIFQDRESLSYN